MGYVAMESHARLRWVWYALEKQEEITGLPNNNKQQRKILRREERGGSGKREEEGQKSKERGGSGGCSAMSGLETSERSK